MSTPRPTHYDTLEIPESATHEEIQAAYFKLVRQYRPGEFPEHFQQLNEARKTLSDPRRRGAYDQSRRSGRNVQALVDQAAIAAEKDPQKAMALLKSAVTLAPDLARPRVLLAKVMMRMQEFPLAERQYRWLLQAAPTDETLHCQLARCLWLQKRDGDAEESLRIALRLNPGFHEAMLALARIYREGGRTQDLLDTLERAVQNDGAENFADFNALLQMLLIRIQQAFDEEANLAARRLLAVIPENRAVDAARAIKQIAQTLFDQESYAWCETLTRLMRSIPVPDDKMEILGELDELQKRARLSTIARRMDADSLLIGALKMCFKTLYLDRSSDTLRQGRMDAAFLQMQREFETDARGLIQRIDYVSREYPAIARDQESFLAQLRQRAQKRADVQTAQQQVRNSIPDASPAPPPAPTPTPRRSLLDRLRGGTKTV